jgi:DnaA family protein
MQHLLPGLTDPPAFTLDTFATGGNAETVHALARWLRSDLHEHCIFLWGPSGSGKTHLVRALVSAAGASAREVQPDQLSAMAEAVHLPHLLALDDVHRLNDEQQGALFRLFQRAVDADALVLAAAPLAPAALAVREDLRTRLASGLTFQLHLLSDEDKVEALQARAHSRGFMLTPDIAHYLINRTERDLRSLMQFLDALDRHSLRTHRPITLPLVRELLQPEADQL